jgi:hypothetical protein
MIKMEINDLISLTMNYFEGDAKRIQHFIKVHSFAKIIGEGEGLNDKSLLTLEAASVVHDVGIKPAEAKYGRCDGKLQEQEGPAKAEELMSAWGATTEMIQRVSYLVGHHHTYSHIDGLDYQILVEADFLVNIYEDQLPRNNVETCYDNIFKTVTGKNLCRLIYLRNK